MSCFALNATFVLIFRIFEILDASSSYPYNTRSPQRISFFCFYNILIFTNNILFDENIVHRWIQLKAILLREIAIVNSTSIVKILSKAT